MASPIHVNVRTTPVPPLHVEVGTPGPPGPAANWWAGTQADYNALPVYDPTTLYIIHT